MGSDLNFSTSMHSEIDGGAMNQCPFEIVMGQQPHTPKVVAIHYAGSNLATYRFVKDRQNIC
ncbi:hypothetical protein EPI10_002047 [Gossypium australe]|uniref:Uncharacterized protein n=1 Tax=Gossypium australe TaxID=47621 RepID=A0A5B6VCQ9_9ROSI|nr:hypothetical protein EPI10_002047 [Gossypium australe]